MSVEIDFMETLTSDALAQAAYKGITYHTINFNETAQIDTAQKKFGGSSLLLDGNSDFLDIDSSADFAFGTGDFTIDFQARWSTMASSIFITIPSYTNIEIQYYHPNHTFAVYIGGTAEISTTDWTPLVDTWYHIAVTRSGTDLKVFIDGTQLGNTATTSYDIEAGIAYIGKRGIYYHHNGWIDEFRILKGTADWTSNFTAPTVPHQIDADTKLLLHFDGTDEATTTIDSSRYEAYSESTIKTQGSYSLKGVAAATDSLNDTLTRTIASPIDLSDQELIKLDARSSETGKTIEATFADSDVKLILNGDGVDGSKEILDSGNTGHIVTQVATAKLSTAQSRFGSTSLLLDGDSDYLTIPTSADWDFSTGDFTVEAWVRVTVGASANGFIFNGATSGDFFFGFSAGEMGIGRAAVAWDYKTTHGIADNTWTHVAVTRNGTNLRLFVGGTQIGTTQTNSTDYDIAGTVEIGDQGAAYYFAGHMDEIRVSKGSARWTTTFTPESTPYTSDANTKLLLHMNTQDESYASHIPTFVGTAQLDTAQKEFGVSSYLFDGDSDYLTFPDSADFSPGTGAFTIDFWIRPHDVSTAYLTVVDMRVGDNNTLNDLAFGTSWEASGYPYIYGMGETPLPTLFATKLTVDTWYHIAIIGNGGADGSRTIKGYLDGVLADGGSVTANYNLNLGKLRIGAMVATSLFYNGHIDGFRITKGRALWTANFTAPAVAPQSVINHIIDIDSADTFQTEEIDIADIANIDKDNIDKVRFRMSCADALNTFYIDNVYATIPTLGNAIDFGANF